MNDNNKMLFEDFTPVSKQEWIDKANIDLKGADFNKKLVWKNLSKIDIQPFYNCKDPQDFLNDTGENSQSLINFRLITVESVKTGNDLALKAIEEGINGLIFDIKETVSAQKLLKGIDLNEITVSFVLTNNELAFANDFFSLVLDQSIDPKNLKGSFDLNIINNYITSGKIEFDRFDTLGELIKLAGNYPNFKAISLSGSTYLDSGANQVQEVAYTLNSLVFLIEELTKRGIDVQSIFNKLQFELAIGSEYFVEIGKFRAFNSLLHEVAKKYSIQDFSSVLIAKTSIWSKSVTDANTNMLRATTEAMSAILGNVDGVLIDAYDKEFKDTSDFSSRIAGNIATILKEESYFGKVSNPVDGSYYIEEVSSKISEGALALFKIIEEHGGFYTSFENGTIQKQIAEIRFEKIKLISQRRLAMVGVNKYPNLMETVASELLSAKQADQTAIDQVLKPRRAALEIEALRKITEDLVERTNQRPIVELTSYGHLAMRKERAAFAYDFMGISGFNVLQEQSHCCAEKAAEESAGSESQVVVICSSDRDYMDTAVEFVRIFRKINTDKVLLLAGNPTDISDQLAEAGLDGFIHIKSDLINTISLIQNKIQKTLNSLEI